MARKKYFSSLFFHSISCGRGRCLRNSEFSFFNRLVNTHWHINGSLLLSFCFEMVGGLTEPEGVSELEADEGLGVDGGTEKMIGQQGLRVCELPCHNISLAGHWETVWWEWEFASNFKYAVT